MKKIQSIAILVIAVLAFVFSACPNGNSKPKKPSSLDDTFSVILPESTPNGTLLASRLTARKNVQVIITAIPDANYKTSWVKYNGIEITPNGSQYSFAMPGADAVITAEFVPGGGSLTYDIYSSGGLNTPAGQWILETNGDPGTALTGDVSVAETQGITGANTRAIKIDLTKIQDYFALRIPLDGMNINFKDVDALTLYAKAGTKISQYVRYPAINRVAFGDYTSDQWVKSVWYCGEAVPDIKYIPLTANWKQISVPVPAHIDHEINTVTLFFTADQVEGQVVYIDQISFVKAESRELVQIVLPSSGSIPYKTNNGGPLASDLERLTRAARFVYSVDGSRFTLYGEDPADGADAFLNRMSDFYNDIKYFAGDNNPVSGKTYTPASAGGTFNLSVSYGGKSSLANTMPNGSIIPSRMAVTVKGLPVTAVGGTLIIDNFENVPTQNDGGKIHVQLPYYWGGTAGDAQSYDDKVLYCWVDNIMQNPMPLLDTGIPLDTWFVAGHMDLNHDLSGTSKIVIGAKLSTGVKYTFTLSSGYTGAASTLKPDGGKYTKQAVMTGLGFEDFHEYVFDLANDFTGDTGFDSGNVTAFEFFIDTDLNAGNDAAFAVPEPCFLQVNGIKAVN